MTAATLTIAEVGRLFNEVLSEAATDTSSEIATFAQSVNESVEAARTERA